MTRGVIVLAASLLTALQVAAAAPQEAPGREPAAAELLLIDGQVWTLTGWAQALAVRNGVIVATGTTAALSTLQGPSTQVLDLDGAAVFPGLHDSHVHPMFAGLEHSSCGFPPGSQPSQIAARIGNCVANAEPGAWIQGGNWVSATFAPGQQNREFLDAIAPEHPVALTDEAHHSLWVNSRALALAGITADTADPPGGIIERDEDGEPNGLLRESATRLVQAVLPPPSEARRREALVNASNQMLAYGITSYTVASVREPDIGPLAALAGENLIRQRVRGCIVWAPPGDPLHATSERLIAQRATYTRGRFQPDCVKIFMDGVPTESHTGAMLDPYEGSVEQGMLLIEPDTLSQGVTRFDRQGLHIKFHAAGDGAVRAAIDAVEAARSANGYGGQSHHVGHSTFVSTADIPRVRELQMAWEFSPYIWYPTPMAAVDIMAAVGEQRMRRWLPIRDAVASGALVVVGSDWSVVPSVNPWLAMETLVTRQLPGGSEQALGAGQSLTLEQALELFTLSGARLQGHSDQVGIITPGMRADLVVTQTNPLEVPITDLHRTKVLLTLIDGEIVFDADAPPLLIESAAGE